MKVREIVTRFGFEVDPRPLAMLDQQISSLKRNLGLLAGAAGIGFGVHQFVQLALSLDRAQVAAAQYDTTMKRTIGHIDLDTGEYVENITYTLGTLQKTFDNLTGLNLGTVLPKDLLNAFVEFKNFTKSGTLEQFGRLAEGAFLMHRITGVNMANMFQRLVSAIKGGHVADELYKIIPTFDALDEAQQEFFLGLFRSIDANAPTIVGMNMALAKTGEILNANLGALKSYAGDIQKSAVGGVEEIQQEIEALFQDLVKNVLPGLTIAIQSIVTNLESLIKNVEGLLHKLGLIFNLTEPTPEEKKGIDIRKQRQRDVEQQPGGWSPWLGGQPSPQFPIVNVRAEININGTDSEMQVARRVKEVLEREIRFAIANFPRTEGVG